MTAYVPSGSFTDGSAPGLDASFFNNIENFLGTVNPGAVNTAMTPVVVNGNSGGTITIWTFFGGTTGTPAANSYKLVLMYFSAFQNKAATLQRVQLPCPFSIGGVAQVGGIIVPTAGNGISTVDNTPLTHNWNVFDGFNSSLSQVILPCYSIGEFNSSMYFMDISNGSTGPANGWVRLEGV